MKTINITEEQKNKLCDILAKIVHSLKQCNNTDCIYFAPYKNYGSINENILIITVVKSDFYFEMTETVKNLYDKFLNSKDIVSTLGVEICIGVDDREYYISEDLEKNNKIKKSNNNLFNSTILFDRTGEYTKIKETLNKNNCYHYGNLAQIVPSITNSLNKQMKVKKMES